MRKQKEKESRENVTMAAKHYAEVLIDGKIYTLGGMEEEHYLQKVASYINEKTLRLRQQEGFSKQSQEYQSVMIALNIADDYFKATEQAAALEKQNNDMEKEVYSLKHELITTQMKLEAALRQIEQPIGQKKAEEEAAAAKTTKK